jgi:hypothetical protein
MLVPLLKETVPGGTLVPVGGGHSICYEYG